MGQENVTVTTSDGEMPTHVFTPTGDGPWPAAIIYMDALAIRPALLGMAQKLADEGYLVLLPDLFYRHGPYPPFDPKAVFAGDFRELIGPFMATTGNAKAAEDTRALLGWLESRTDVAGEKIGVLGFCMGGRMALYVAGIFSDRVAAAVSLHGGNLANDAPDSPHLLAPKIEAELYVGAADEDHAYSPEMAEKLEAALTDAGVSYVHEWYKGSHHGWTMPDFPVYDPPAAERSWAATFDLFDRILK
ncbi:dienelactone hydrolase family protein [Sphingomonas nostoxanthinifaciens]|uniref:dienelactone hydrolase family protein n=1 Tax=Sphingomonas nostoxanthinifaciens TaxID=2872652 RepID=UPI001CC1C375|nr:dienelactone hydrolase family protein [Sphingomonas nostoxanthinifaciens]UAK25115.1 dienelactone hydrolase family protein [Sphingomonas nostoxanthinifaciens]